MMIRALEQLPAPAAMFELPGGRFVANNQRGKDLQETGESAVAALHRYGLCPHIQTGLGMKEGDAYTTHIDHPGIGWVLMSVLPSHDYTHRPDLMLLTAHPGMAEKHAWLDHNRLATSVRINENSELTIRTIESTLVQLQAALSAQTDMITEYNGRASDVLRSLYPLHETGA